MAIPESLNARIAQAKGWTWHAATLLYEIRTGIPVGYPDMIITETGQTHWKDAADVPRKCANWVGTLKGVAELMRELEETQRWFSWGYNIYTHRYVCIEDDEEVASSPEDRPGDCVGATYLSVFGEENDE